MIACTERHMVALCFGVVGEGQKSMAKAAQS